MLYLSKLEEVVRNYCIVNGKSFEAIMNVITNSEEDFSELVVHNNCSTEVITIDSHRRGTMLLSAAHGLMKLS